MANTYPDATARTLAALCTTYLRTPDSVATDDQTGNPILTFVPVLTAPEQATFSDLSTMAKFGVTMTLTEWQGIKADAANLKAYIGIATPTLVQTAAATKSIIRVLATIVRS